MLSAAIWLLTNSLFWSLRLSGTVGSFPKPLSSEEERDYLKRLEEGDEEARNVLIEHNLRLVAHVIKKYYTQAEEQDDLISIGTIGLIKGISSYKPNKGTHLATYAARCVENEILMYFRSMKKTAADVSLSEYIETGKDGNALSLLDVICSEEDLFEDLSAREMADRLHAVMDEKLTDREKTVLSLRYGLRGCKVQTQREIADRCGISRSYVSCRRKCKRCPESLESTGLSGHQAWWG